MFIFFASLYLNSDRDIIALNSPHDEYWHIHKALNFFSDEPYSSMVNIHSPLYALWIYVMNGIGIPLIFGTTFICQIGNVYISYVLFKVTRSRLLSTILFLLLAFHPFSFVINNRALAETLLVPLTTIAFASMIQILHNKISKKIISVPLALLFYFSFAGAYYIRKEGVVLIPFLLSGFLFFLCDKNRIKDKIKSYLFLIVLPVVGSCLLLSTSLSVLNYIKFDKYENYATYNSNYQDLMKALISIDLGQTPYHVSVSSQMLLSAFEISPTLSELRPAFDGPVGRMWKDISSNYLVDKNEIGSGWFYWAIRDAGQFAGWFKSPKLADEKFAAATNEINKAYESGRLMRRSFVFNSFLDPDYRKWLPYLPNSMIRVLQSMIPKYYPDFWPQPTATVEQASEYFVAAGRRRPTPHSVIVGWVQAPIGSSLKVGNTHQILSGPERPDVKGGLPFKLEFEGKLSNEIIELRVNEKNSFTTKTGNLVEGKVNKFDQENSPDIGIDYAFDTETNIRFSKYFKQIIELSSAFGIFLLVSTIAALPIVFLRLECELSSIYIIGIVLVCSRVVLFAILDASSWSGTQIRYLYPVIPVLLFTGLISVAKICHAVTSKINKYT